jgi:hypothetical protein
MSCKVHEKHEHVHGTQCGHTAIQHDGHTDYLHDNHLHYVHEGHVDEHSLAVGKLNAADCTPSHTCKGHEQSHKHSSGCGHEAIPHGEHTDYIVDGHLHSPHQGHCDDHGAIKVG